MLIKPLSVAEVRLAKPRDKDYSIHDGFGLLLYISKSGGKSWRFRYSHPITKKRQTYTIGRYPEFTLAEAREERETLRRMVARRVDPNEERRARIAEEEKKHAQIFAQIALNWLELKNNQGLRENTIISIERTVKNYIIPAIGDMKIHSITAPVVISIFNDYRDRPAILNYMISKSKAIMDYAINSGIISSNPIAKINNAFPALVRTPVKSLPVEKLPEFLDVWKDCRGSFVTIRALEFQILTMVRPNEAFGAMWAEVNFDEGLWTIPATRMKSKRMHIVPLSAQAIVILREMQKVRYNEYVFFGLKKSITRPAVSKVLNSTSFKGKLTLHGFRSMWSTLLNEEGFNPDVIEAALAHKSGDAVRDIYNRTTYLEQRRKMMQWVGDFMDSARNGVINRTDGFKGLKVVNE